MMSRREVLHIGIAFVVLTITAGFYAIIKGDYAAITMVPFFSALILATNILAKKIAARSLDADVEHEIWLWSRFGLKPGHHTAKPVPLGAILPLVISAFSLGVIKCMTLLTYETSALKRRAARRFGPYSFTEITDWHTALIGTAGIGATLLLAFISYFIPGLEGLPTLATYYAFWNIIPFSKLDGAQILFGSKVLYASLSIITLIMTGATFVIS